MFSHHMDFAVARGQNRLHAADLLKSPSGQAKNRHKGELNGLIMDWSIDARNLQPGLQTYLWLARNEGMDPSSCPYITHYGSFYALLHVLFPANLDI